VNDERKNEVVTVPVVDLRKALTDRYGPVHCYGREMAYLVRFGDYLTPPANDGGFCG